MGPQFFCRPSYCSNLQHGDVPAVEFTAGVEMVPVMRIKINSNIYSPFLHLSKFLTYPKHTPRLSQVVKIVLHCEKL